MTAPPHDRDAEYALIGDMLALPLAVEQLIPVLEPGDFYDPTCAVAYECLIDGYMAGRLLDHVVLRSAMKAKGREPTMQWLADVLGAGGGAYMAKAGIVNQHRMRRQMLAAAYELAEKARSDADPEAVLDQHHTALGGITVADGAPPSTAKTDDAFLAQNVGELDAWVIPGLLRKEWCAMVVAHEGKGKSLLLQQFAVAASQGIHPLFQSMRIDPVRTLLIDCENPLADLHGRISSLAALVPDYTTGRFHIWHENSGIDLRSRHSRSDLERCLRKYRPQLVCLGPLYKTFLRHERESDEEATKAVQDVLDDMRSRYGFALLVEHHAPQYEGRSRYLRPYGSSLWLRWPEVGLTFEEKDPMDKPHVFTVGRFRDDRAKTAWPQRLEHGDRWPWVGWWSDGRWQREVAGAYEAAW